MAQIWTPGSAIAGASTAGTVNVGYNTNWWGARLNVYDTTQINSSGQNYYGLNVETNFAGLGIATQGAQVRGTRSFSYNGTNLWGVAGFARYTTDMSSVDAYGVDGVVEIDDGVTLTGAGLHGVRGWVTSNGATSSSGCVGVKGLCENGQDRYGVSGIATGGGTNAFGARGEASGATTNYGLRGDATGSATTNYGVYGNASGASTNYSAYFNGATAFTSVSWTVSDRQFKKNINDLSGALSLISKLDPKTYEFDHAVHPGIHLAEGKQFGLISQDVEQVIPELVQVIHHPEERNAQGELIEAAFDYKGMNYAALIPILIGGIKEQQAIIEDKQAQIDALTERLDKLEASLNGETKVAPGAGGGPGGAQLFQNEPNPFDENTTIRYSLPEGTQASLEVLNTSGQVVKSFSHLGTGSGQVLIAAGALPAGVYTYALVINGKRTETKRMVITR